MFQILDFVLFGIMFISGLLALARGFTREVLSLIAWAAGIGAGWYASKQKPLTDLVMPYVDPTKPAIAQIIVAVTAFILVLIIVSVIGVKISDRVVDSSAGAFDRTLGLIYGLARGLVLVGICHLIYGFIIPTNKQEDWVRNAVTLPAIAFVSETIKEYLPPDIIDTLNNSALIGNGPVAAPKPAGTDQGTGYTNGQTQGLDNLTNNAAQPQQPAVQP